MFLFVLCFKATNELESWRECDETTCASIDFSFNYCGGSVCRTVERITIPLSVDRCFAEVYCFFEIDNEHTFGFLTDSLSIIDNPSVVDCPESLTIFAQTSSFVIQRLNMNVIVSPVERPTTRSRTTPWTTTVFSTSTRTTTSATTTRTVPSPSTIRPACSFDAPVTTWAKRLHMFFDDLNDLVTWLINFAIHLTIFFAAKKRYSNISAINSESNRQQTISLIPRPVAKHSLEATKASSATSSTALRFATNAATFAQAQTALPCPASTEAATNLSTVMTIVAESQQETIKCNCSLDCSQERFCVCKRNGQKCNIYCHQKKQTKCCINK